MIRFDLLLCQEVFLRFLQQQAPWKRDEAEARLKEMISQHSIVLSPSLLGCYEEYFESCGEGVYDLYYEFIASEAPYLGGPFLFIDDEVRETAAAKDIDSILINLAKNSSLSNPYVLCNGCGSKSLLSTGIKPQKPLYLPLVPFDSIDNRLSRNSPTFSIQVHANEQCDKYSCWFGELFYGEKQISIFDNYILNDEDHLDSFIGYYLNRMKNTTLEIFIGVADYDWTNGNLKTRLNTIAEQKNIIIKVYSAQGKPLHGRYIYIKNYRVSLDHGLDFLDNKTKRTKGDNSIHFEKAPNGAMLTDIRRLYPYSLLYCLNEEAV